MGIPQVKIVTFHLLSWWVRGAVSFVTTEGDFCRNRRSHIDDRKITDTGPPEAGQYKRGWKSLRIVGGSYEKGHFSICRIDRGFHHAGYRPGVRAGENA